MIENKRLLLTLVSFLLICAGFLIFFAPDIAYAGPGAIFAKAAKAKTWLLIILIPVMIILFPLFLYVMIIEKKAVWKCKKRLKDLSGVAPEMNWAKIDQQVQYCFKSIWDVWSSYDLSQAKDLMTNEYYYAQQALLEDWQDQGHTCIAKLHRLKTIEPIHLDFEQGHKPVIWIRFKAKVTDALKDSSGKIIQGKKGSDEQETIWGFLYDGRSWKLAQIEDGKRSLTFAKKPKSELETMIDVLADLQQKEASKEFPEKTPAKTDDVKMQ